MKSIALLPPENLSTRLSGETMGRLKLYQNYQKENGAVWKLDELAAELLGIFLAEGDPAFNNWCNKPIRESKRANGTVDATGITHDA